MFKLERRISMLNSTDASIVNSARLNQISFCYVKVNLKQCFDSSLLWNGMFSGKHISFFYFNFGNAFSVFHFWQTHIVVDIGGKTFMQSTILTFVQQMQNSGNHVQANTINRLCLTLSSYYRGHCFGTF